LLLNDEADVVALRCSSTARQGGEGNRRLRRLIRVSCVSAACGVAFAATDAQAADTVRISALSDVSFGTIANFSTDYLRSQSICVHSKTPPGNYYRVTAVGSGAGGAFILNYGSSTLPYEVQWSAAPSQSVGTQLVANQPLTGQQTTSGSGDADDCSRGPATTASLIVVVRSASVAAATSGTYSGTLSLVIGPE